MKFKGAVAARRPIVLSGHLEAARTRSSLGEHGRSCREDAANVGSRGGGRLVRAAVARPGYGVKCMPRSPPASRTRIAPRTETALGTAANASRVGISVQRAA